MKSIIVMLNIVLFSTLVACGGGSGSGDPDPGPTTDGDTNVGSGDNSDSGGAGGSGDDSDTGSASSDSGSAGGDNTILEGTWHKACGPIDAFFPEDGYDIVTITITGNQFNSEIENYLDSSCSQPTPEYPTASASGTLSVGEDVNTTNGLTATEVDTVITQSSDPDLFIEYTYDIFYIDGDNLYFGEFEAETPEERDDTLDLNRVHVRQ